MRSYDQSESPIGTLTLVQEGDAIVGLYMGEHRHVDAQADWGERRETDLTQRLKAELAAYFAGDRREFDIPIRMHGTVFQRRVWDELRKIPYGTTISYGELARRVGDPKGSRAVGMANGRNPVSILVPCHRVIGSNGKLVGYGGGLERKAALLDLEQTNA